MAAEVSGWLDLTIMTPKCERADWPRAARPWPLEAGKSRMGVRPMR